MQHAAFSHFSEPRWPNLFAHVNRKTGCATNQLRIFCFVPCIHGNQHSTPSARLNFCGRVVFSVQKHHSKQHSTPIVKLKFLGRVVFSVGNLQNFHSHNGENLMQSLKILNTEKKVRHALFQIAVDFKNFCSLNVQRL